MKFLFIFLSLFCFKSAAQSSWPSQSWNTATNLTSIMDSNGITDLSGLHWNSVTNRLYCVQDSGRLRVLQLNTANNTFSQIASKVLTGGPEGITQVDLSSNTFYTIDENNYEIQKYNHSSNFSTVTLSRHWNLLASPSPMPDSGNTGPEGIVFVPDSFIASSGFISSLTGLSYTSVKGMGGLMFIANQNGGYIWVFDVNPNVNDDFAYVGKYKTNRSESCDLAFDQSTGMLYILHNISGNNKLEVTNLATTIVGGERKFSTVNEYFVTNSGTNENIEGFALTPKCPDASITSVWLCRDVETNEDMAVQQDALRWFNPFTADGSCLLEINTLTQSEITVFPNPAKNLITISLGEYSQGEFLVRIYNSLGQMVFSQNTNKNIFSADVSTLENGLYILEIIQGSKSTKTKFIKA